MKHNPLHRHIPRVVYGSFLLIALIAATMGMTFTDMGLGEWGKEFVVPSFAPSIFTFTLLWVAAFFLLSVPGARIWKQDHRRGRALALLLWFAYLLASIGWFALFFTVKSVILALGQAAVLSIIGGALFYVGHAVDARTTLYLLLTFLWSLYILILNTVIFFENLI